MGFVQWIQKQSVAYTVYGLALLAMVALLAVIVAKLFFIGTKSDKLEYLKNYKKGQFVIIYLIAIPLYFFGLLHASNKIQDGTDVLNCFLNSFKLSLYLVKLDFGMGNILKTMKTDTLYYIAMTTCFAVTLINVLMFSASLLLQRFKNFCKKVVAHSSKNLYIVVGGNDNNILLLNSLKKHGNKKARGVILVKPDAEMRDKLYLNGLCYSVFDSVSGSKEDFNKKIKSFLGFRYKHKLYMKKNITVIINTEDDERNLLYVKALNELLQTKIRNLFVQEKSEKDKENENPINSTQLINVPVNAKEALVMVYAFCKIENQSVFKDIVDDSLGHINLMNRYEQIAFDFVDKYPLTHYMTDKHIDYKKGLIRNYENKQTCNYENELIKNVYKDNNDNKKIEINVCFVGFGDTNRQIFLKTISNSQFFTEVDNKLVHKKVHYYVFDNTKAYEDKNLNQTYFRYSLEFYKEYKEYRENMLKWGISEGSEKWDYLPLPDYPADDWYNPESNPKLSDKENGFFKSHFCETDINSYEFYDGLKKVICNGKSYTYIIVAFGGDLENIDLAKKISARLEMWNKSKDAHVFVKVRSGSLADQNKNEDGIIKFGSDESVYDMNKIVDNHIKKLAFLKSFNFTSDNDGNTKNCSQKAVEKWMKLSPEQKAGNFYSCLNLKTKLNLLGYTYVADDKSKDDKEEFYKDYFGTTELEEIKKLRYYFESKDKETNDYNYDKKIFNDGSVRTLLAIQEHQRWNANYICSGVIPSKKSEIDGKGGGKDMKKKLIHFNLTTFDGLEEYRIKAVGSADDSKKYKKEVRQYDYTIMDNADKILSEAGYKIIRRKEDSKKEN